MGVFRVSIYLQRGIVYVYGVLVKNAVVPSQHSNQPIRTKVHEISLIFDVIVTSDSL
jgi:hypothetical protein